MSKENLFVAEVYNRLWPWIEHNDSLCFCLDDGGQGSSSTPDLCFRFAGQSDVLRIECKIIYSERKGRTKKKNHLRASKKQLTTWRKPSKDAPHLWIAKREDRDEYFLWPHDDEGFLTNFATVASSLKAGEKFGLVGVPDCILDNTVTFPGLFLGILQFAADKGFMVEKATQ